MWLISIETQKYTTLINKHMAVCFNMDLRKHAGNYWFLHVHFIRSKNIQHSTNVKAWPCNLLDALHTNMILHILIYTLSACNLLHTHTLMYEKTRAEIHVAMTLWVWTWYFKSVPEANVSANIQYIYIYCIQLGTTPKNSLKEKTWWTFGFTSVIIRS